MNLYELAENLESWANDVYGGGKTLTDAANMLRQQQSEIEALKLQIKGYQQSTKHYRELHEGFSTINDLGFQQIELNSELLRKAQKK